MVAQDGFLLGALPNIKQGGFPTGDCSSAPRNRAAQRCFENIEKEQFAMRP